MNIRTKPLSTMYALPRTADSLRIRPHSNRTRTDQKSFTDQRRINEGQKSPLWMDEGLLPQYFPHLPRQILQCKRLLQKSFPTLNYPFIHNLIFTASVKEEHLNSRTCAHHLRHQSL